MRKKFKLALMILLVSVVMLPLVSFAAVDWGVGLNSNGDFSIGVGSGSGGYGGGYGGGWGLVNDFGLPAGSITGIVTGILIWLLTIFGVIGIIGFVISGAMYILAAGDEKAMETAKNAMKYSIIGVLVGLSGYVIIQAVAAILSNSAVI